MRSSCNLHSSTNCMNNGLQNIARDSLHRTRLKNIIKIVHSPFIEKSYEESLEISDLWYYYSSKSLRMFCHSYINYRKTNRRISKFKTETHRRKIGRKDIHGPTFHSKPDRISLCYNTS